MTILNTIESNRIQQAALEAVKARQAAADELMRSESVRIRKQRVKGEARRMMALKEGKAKAAERRVTITVMEEGEKKVTVRKIVTTADKMFANGMLPKHLKTALNAFALLVADGYGAATRDDQDSTSRLTGSYEPMSGGGFGSRTPSDRQLAGLGAMREMEKRVPQELRSTFYQLIGEETGNLIGVRRSLAEIGEDHGYTHRQASSAGGMEVYCVCALICHYMRDWGAAI